jgi:hypothetical protein
MADDTPTTDLPYESALHAIQTGVKFDHELGSNDGTPKHLRVGIASAMVNDAALVRLLVKKGLFTHEEYLEELRLEACREVDRYEARIAQATGRTVTLR